MANSLGTVYVDLQANTGGFVSALSKAAATAQKSSRDIAREFEVIGRAGTKLSGTLTQINPQLGALANGFDAASNAASNAARSFASMGGAISALAGFASGAAAGLLAVGAAAIGIAVHASESAAKMYDLSRSTGVSASALGAWSFAAKEANLDQEQITKSLQLLAANMVKAVQSPKGAAGSAFKTLGLDVKEANGQLKQTGDFMLELLKKLDQMRDKTAAIGLSRETIGRGGAAMLQVDPSELQHAIDLFNKLHPEFDANAAAAHEFQVKLKEIGEAIQSVEYRLMADLLPALQKIASAMQAWLGDPRNIATLQHIADAAAMCARAVLNFADSLLFLGRAGEAISTFGSSNPFKAATWEKFSADMKGALQSAKDAWASAPGAPVFNLETGFSAAEAALKRLKQTAQDTTEPINLAKGAHDKLATALTDVIAKANEEIATFGKGGIAMEMYRLKVLGATDAELAHVKALMLKADAFTKFPKPVGAPGKEPGWFEKLHSKELADEFHQGTATDLFAGIAPESIAGLNLGAGLEKSPLQDALDAAEKAGMRLESRGASKFGFKGQDVATLERMRDALASVGDSTVLVDAAIQSAMTNATKRFDEAAMAAGSLQDKFRAMANEMVLAGQNLSGKMVETFTRGFESLSDELAKFIITGKANFKSFLDGIAEQLLRAQIQAAFAKIFSGMGGAGAIGPGGTAGIVKGPVGGVAGTLASIFGIGGKGGGKAPTGTATDPIYVATTSGSGLGIGALPLGGKGGGWLGLPAPGSGGGNDGSASLMSKFEGIFTKLGTTLEGVFSKVISGLSSAIGSIAGSLGGFMKFFGLAGGGPVASGHPYIVGENRPEVFIPNVSGRIVPSVPEFLRGRRASSPYFGAGAAAGAGILHVEMHLHGVTDADSFMKSQDQIWADMHSSIGRAQYRSGNGGGF